jgi:hypothetical protein
MGLFLLAISSPPDRMISVNYVEKFHVLIVKRPALLRFHQKEFPQMLIFPAQAAVHFRHGAKLGNLVRHHLEFSLYGRTSLG